MPQIHMSRRRFIVLSALFAAVNVTLWSAFVISRPPLDREGWQFLEKQRPQIVETPNGFTESFNICADCTNLALARRPVGGWETALVKLTQAVDVVGYGVAVATFHALQDRPGGTSRSHSDVATAVFVIVSVLQWLTVAYVGSLHGQPEFSR